MLAPKQTCLLEGNFEASGSTPIAWLNTGQDIIDLNCQDAVRTKARCDTLLISWCFSRSSGCDHCFSSPQGAYSQMVLNWISVTEYSWVLINQRVSQIASKAEKHCPQQISQTSQNQKHFEWEGKKRLVPAWCRILARRSGSHTTADWKNDPKKTKLPRSISMHSTHS